MEQINLLKSPSTTSVVDNKNSASVSSDDSKKTYYEKPDGAKLIAAGLSALGVIAAATIAIAKRKSPGKAASEAGEQLQEVASKTIRRAVPNAAEQVADVATNVQRVAKDVAEEASQAVSNGGNYQKIKSGATRNFSHDDKKVVKEALSEAKDALNKADKQRVANRSSKFNIVDGAKTAIDNQKVAMKSATNSTEILTITSEADEAARRAKNNARALADTAVTRREKKLARVANNRANEVQKKANSVHEMADKKSVQLANEHSDKITNLDKMKKTAGYAEGLEKQKQNAIKTQENAVKRMNKKELQRAKNKFSGKNTQYLQSILDSNKYANETEKTAIMQIISERQN